MRPDIEKIFNESGITGVIEFLKNVGNCGIWLTKRETDVITTILASHTSEA